MAGLAASLTIALLTLTLLADVTFAVPLTEVWDGEDTPLSRAFSAGLLQLQTEGTGEATLNDREKRFVGHHSGHHRGGVYVTKSQLKEICDRLLGRSKRHAWGRAHPHRHLCQYIARGY